MDVFLVPLGDQRYALYSEAEPSVVDEDAAAPQTLWARAVGVFRRMLAEGEAERRRDPSVPPPNQSRFRRWIATHLANAVAEQQLLWSLRKESEAVLVHPDDETAAIAIERAREQLTRERSRHSRWLVIDSAIAIASIPVAIVPGPNVLGYYFLFRAVGHLFSLRGARRGIKVIAWHSRPTPHLTALRAALSQPDSERAPKVRAIAEALGLKHLPAFLDVAAKPQDS